MKSDQYPRPSGDAITDRKRMNRKTRKIIAYGTDWKAAKPIYWHADCHGPMRKKRGQYMLTAMRYLYEGFTFDDPQERCAHCGQLMVVAN